MPLDGDRRSASPSGAKGCVFCRRRNSARARFCRRCGSRMSTTWSPPPPPPPRAPPDSTPLVLAVGLIVVLVLGLIGVGWALYDPWGGAAVGGDEPVAAPPAAARASGSGLAVPARRQASRTRSTATAPVRHERHAFGRSAFAEYGVTLYYPRGWRELPASLVNEEVPYWNETLTQDQDVLAAYLPPSGDGAVIAFADHYPEPELSRFELRLDGEVVLRELAGLGLPEVRLHGEKIAGRQAMVSDTIVTPDITMVAAIVMGKDRLYYFAITGRDETALNEVRRGYWPALQRTEFTAAQPG